MWPTVVKKKKKKKKKNININVLYIYVLFYETLHRHFGCNLQDVQVQIKKSV